MSTSAAAANSDFQLPPSPSHHHHLFASTATHQNHRKKRSKLIRISNIPTTSTGAISKPKYGKKPDPGAPKITRPCSECGKKFWSWKALFGHMRCHPERQWRGINPPPNFRQTGSPAKPLVREFKEAMIVEDHEVAASLLMLANGPSAMEVTCGASYPNVQEYYEPFVLDNAGTSLNCRFECSSCKKVFGSHQALGGHRASHKNVKGCFAITRSDSEVEDHNERDCEEVVAKESSVEEKMAMVLGGNGHGHGHGHGHKCSICWRVFSSGQALGGHKRCHWEKGEEPLVTRDQGCKLDLNLPAPTEDDLSSTTSYSSGLTLDLRLGL